jgi:hypothetical protein
MDNCSWPVRHWQVLLAVLERLCYCNQAWKQKSLTCHWELWCFTHECHRFCVLVPEAISIKTVVPASEILTSSPSGLRNAYAITTDYGKTWESYLHTETVGITHRCHRFYVLVPKAMSTKTTMPVSEMLTSSLSGSMNEYAITIELEDTRIILCLWERRSHSLIASLLRASTGSYDYKDDCTWPVRCWQALLAVPVTIMPI